MIAEIICVGTELLMGQIVNTNAQFMAEKLAPLGVDLYRQQVVGDNPKRLTEAVLTALSRSDVVLFSGGLGPTEDDLTKETVAAALGLELVLYPEEWDRIVGYFQNRGRMPAPNNRKQAMFPATNCTILPNPRGTAPGCLMEKDGKAAILMPGPPRELRPMFTDYVMPYLEKRSGHRLYTHMLRIFGKGESDVEYELKDLIDSQTNPTLATYCETGEVKLRITAQARDDAEGEALLAPVVQEVARLYPVLCEEYADACRRFKNDGKRTERMSVRALLVDMNNGTLSVISYNDEGKPMLRDGRYISISHTKGFVAVIISEQHPVGVDVEYYSDRVGKVAKRFVREDEWTEDIDALLVIWSAKETVYKLFSEDNLWFDEMRTAPFHVQTEGFVEVENLKKGITVRVFYEINEDYVLTYSIL